MDAGTVRIVAETKKHVRKIQSNQHHTGPMKFDLIAKRALNLDVVLKRFTKDEKTCCCQGPRPPPRGECDIINLVRTMLHALNIMIYVVPDSYSEMTDLASYYPFCTALDEMQFDYRACRRDVIKCKNITNNDVTRWREICGSLQMMIYSRFDFGQNKDWVTTKVRGIKNDLDDKHCDKWEMIGRQGFTLPEVKMDNGIDHLLDHRLDFGARVIFIGDGFDCSNCGCHEGSRDCFALLDVCDHRMCFKCGYKMAANGELKCNICQKYAERWSTKTIIMATSRRHSKEVKERSLYLKSCTKKGIGFVSVLTLTGLYYNYYYSPSSTSS